MSTQKKSHQEKTTPTRTDNNWIPSHYDLFRGRLTFSNEPAWLRIALVALVLAAPILLILLVHQYAWPVLSIRWLSNASWMKVLFHWKSRSP